MKTERKNCIFCDNGKSFIGKEHVIPAWILRTLNYETKPQPFFETLFNKIEDFEVESKSRLHAKFSFDKFRSPYVCDDCNTHGWMKELEDKTAPILKPFIHGYKDLEDLTESEKHLIARWAVKTTCVIESVNFTNSPYISFDPKIVKDQQTLPLGWAVFAFTHNPTSTLSWFSNDVWFVEGNLTNELRGKCERFKKTIFQFKNLVIATIFIGDERLKLKAVESTHFPLDINLNCEWVSQSASLSFTSYRNVAENSSDDLMFRFLGAFSLCVI